MRVCHIAKSATWIKWLAAGFLLSVLTACGGGSSSSGCIGGGSGCDDTDFGTIDAMGTDGPLTFALMGIERLDDWIADAPSANLIKALPTSSDGQGLANDIVLIDSAGSGPFVLEVTADAATRDLTTGQPPAVTRVYTLISQSQLQQSPRPRFYATALTSLALDRAVFQAGGTPDQADLDAARVEIINLLGFGMVDTVDIFSIAPIFDDNTSVIEQQEKTAAYRTALETLAEVLEAAAVPAGVSPQRVFEELLIEFSESGSIGNPSETTNADDVIIGHLVTAINAVDPAYLASSGRFPTPAPESFADVEELLVGEAPATSPLDGLPGDLDGFITPAKPDFDGDNVPNDDDLDPYDPTVSRDTDADTVDDTVDNCIDDPNLGQEDEDVDGVGNACDIDADGDGVDGDGMGGPGVDDNDLDAAIVTDPDGDDIDDIGGTSPNGSVLNGPDNCVAGKILFSGLPEEFILSLAQAANNGQDDLDNDGEGNACDGDADNDTAPGDGLGGSGEALFGAGVGDPNDLDASVSPTDADADGVVNSADNCPNTPNGPLGGSNNQVPASVNANGLGVPFGTACDVDEDGWPTSLQIQPGGQFTSITNPDNCPSVANSTQDDNDADGQGDLCDLDNDSDGLPNALAIDSNSVDRDPAEFESVSTYLFDTFYFEQSDDGAGTGFKLATVSESVLSSIGSIVAVAGIDHILDVGTDGNNDNTYMISANDYSTVENSLVFSGAGFGASPALPVINTELSGAGSNATAVSYSVPNLSLQSSTMFPWGNTAFVGSGRDSAGRPDLPAVGSTLANDADQALTSLLYIDQNNAPTNATLNGTYGFVDMTVDYTDTATTNLVNVTSHIYDMALSAGGVIAGAANSEYAAAIGYSDGSVTYNTTAVAETGYTVATTAAVTFTDSGMQGITSADGSLIAISKNNMRGYAVQLGSAVTAADLDAAGTFDLTGLVMQPDVDNISTYTLSGATIRFSDDGLGSLTANLQYGSSSRASADFDSGNTALPAIAAGVNPQSPGNSEPFTIDANGRIPRIVFGAGSGQRPAELEGFYVPGKGLLLRYVETNFAEQGSGGSSTNSYCGSSADVTFVDPNTGIPLDPQPAPGFFCGFVISGVSGSLTKLSDAARGAVGVAQVFSVLTAAADTNLSGDGFGQGIVWGIPQ